MTWKNLERLAKTLALENNPLQLGNGGQGRVPLVWLGGFCQECSSLTVEPTVGRRNKEPVGIVRNSFTPRKLHPDVISPEPGCDLLSDLSDQYRPGDSWLLLTCPLPPGRSSRLCQGASGWGGSQLSLLIFNLLKHSSFHCRSQATMGAQWPEGGCKFVVHDHHSSASPCGTLDLNPGLRDSGVQAHHQGAELATPEPW